MTHCGIYMIKNVSNEKVYIGQSIDITQRFCLHRYRLRRNIHENPRLQQSWNKHGEDSFVFSILEECDSSSLDEKETYYISLYNSYHCGYNRATGGKQNYTYNNPAKEICTASGRKNLQTLHEKKLSEKNKCLICGKETKDGYNKYCNEHKKVCIKCGKRFPDKFKQRVLCENCYTLSKTSKCEICGNEFKKNCNRQRICIQCAPKNRKEKNRIWSANRRDNKKLGNAG